MGVRLLTGAGLILLALGRSGRPLSFMEIKEATGLSPSTIDANLKALQKEGLVERVGGRYRLTPQGRARVKSLVLEVAGG